MVGSDFSSQNPNLLWGTELMDKVSKKKDSWCSFSTWVNPKIAGLAQILKNDSRIDLKKSIKNWIDRKSIRDHLKMMKIEFWTEMKLSFLIDLFDGSDPWFKLIFVGKTDRIGDFGRSGFRTNTTVSSFSTLKKQHYNF